MSARNILAPLLLGGFTAWRALAGRRYPPQAFRILLLHDIPERHRGALDRLLSWIGQRHGFLSPAEAEARLSGNVTGGASGRVPVLVSFDDGFVSNHLVARAVLATHGVRAVFFICPGLMDLAPEEQKATVAKRLYRAQPPTVIEPLMGWEQIGELREGGHLIAVHTMNHRDLSSLTGDALEEEILRAGTRIREETGAWPDWFAWPFGDIAAIDAGALGVISRHYKFCRSGIRGVNAPGGSGLELFADHVDLDASFSWQKLALEGGLDGRYRSARARLAEIVQTADR
jgi:peptidoglycan/xylan/chitin deacetylase (PgdA/CDA1 family)